MTTTKPRKFSRRKFIRIACVLTPFGIIADARAIEPQWIKTTHLKLSAKPEHRFVQFSDLHHKGDRSYLESVVKHINTLAPDFVCFTGDLVEDAKFLPETLEILSGIKVPLYGIPGNHDYLSNAPFEPISKCFAATGGAWLEDDTRVIANGKINLVGVARLGPQHSTPSPKPGMKNILLIHYPAWAKRFDEKFDLVLAGHSHGGQVRLPFYGPIVVPFLVDEYDLGLFQTKAGPLYVNAGIGWFYSPIRFNCRPEITVIEI